MLLDGKQICLEKMDFSKRALPSDSLSFLMFLLPGEDSSPESDFKAEMCINQILGLVN